MNSGWWWLGDMSCYIYFTITILLRCLKRLYNIIAAKIWTVNIVVNIQPLRTCLMRVWSLAIEDTPYSKELRWDSSGEEGVFYGARAAASDDVTLHAARCHRGGFRNHVFAVSGNLLPGDDDNNEYQCYCFPSISMCRCILGKTYILAGRSSCLSWSV